MSAAMEIPTRRTHEIRIRENVARRACELARLNRFASFLIPAILDEYNIAHEDLFSFAQSRRISRPRQIAMFFLHDHPDALFVPAQIAYKLSLDRSTILYGVATARTLIARDYQLARQKAQRVADVLHADGFRSWKVSL